MDNQNNQNQQNGYTNFNNYQPTVPTPPPADGTQSNPYQQQSAPQGYPNPYQQPNMPQGYPQQAAYQQYPYQVPVQEENKGMVLGIISIVLSVLSCCCAFFSSIPGAICGLIGVIRNKKSVVSWIGLICGILGTIAWIAYFVYIFSNPDQLREILNQSYGEEYTDELLKELYGFIVASIRF